MVAGVDGQLGVGAASHERVGRSPILGEPPVVGHAVDLGGVAVGPAAEVAGSAKDSSAKQAPGAWAVLRELLGGRFPPSVLDDLLLLVSELVANAVAATSQPIQLTVACDDDMLKVELFDDSALLPSLGDFGPLAEEGRGLWLVDAIACAWRTVPHPYGKTVAAKGSC